ncbi:MAG: hypothetical protein ACTSW4_05245 [Candidatus Ranarchaeia archaeon]
MMGRTVPSIRQAIETKLKVWTSFSRGLRKEEREIFEQLLIDARLHVDASSLTMTSNLNILILMSIMLEQEKRIRTLTDRLQNIIDKKGV